VHPALSIEATSAGRHCELDVVPDPEPVVPDPEPAAVPLPDPPLDPVAVPDPLPVVPLPVPPPAIVDGGITPPSGVGAHPGTTYTAVPLGPPEQAKNAAPVRVKARAMWKVFMARPLAGVVPGSAFAGRWEIKAFGGGSPLI
jgi:hypothetical protein